MSYIITKGKTDQVERIFTVNHEIFKDMYEKPPYTLEYYHEKIADVEPIIFVAEFDNEIIGNSISFERNDSLYVWVLGVAEYSRRQGIATKLFDKNEEFARENKLATVTVKVYNVSTEMLRLLLGRGYNIIDVEKSDSDSKYNIVHLELLT